MKLRKGFVSNSSSSSFVITSKEPLDINSILESSNISKDFIFYELCKEAISSVILCADELKTEKDFYKHYGTYNSLEEFMEDCSFPKKAMDNFKRGHHIYVGGFSSEQGGIESGLCDMSFNIDKEDFYFKQSGGY